MQRTAWQRLGLAGILVVALVGSAPAQQHQQHHPGGSQESQQEPAGTSSGTSAQPPMMERMQGMMERMRGMMERMQGMMGPRGRTGMRAQEEEHEDDADAEDPPRQRGMMGRRGMMGHDMMGQAGMIRRHFERLAQQLALSDAQRAQALPLLSTHAKNFIRLRAELDTLNIDLQELLEADTIDLVKAKQLLQAIAAKEADLRLEHITAMESMPQLLTPEQQKKFRALRSHMMGAGGMMGHSRMMRGESQSR